MDGERVHASSCSQPRLCNGTVFAQPSNESLYLEVTSRLQCRASVRRAPATELMLFCLDDVPAKVQWSMAAAFRLLAESTHLHHAAITT